MNKDAVKSRSLPIDPPNRAATLHRFLSDHPKEAGVKIKGRVEAPVLKVQANEPRKLDESSRKTWSFHLLNMQQKLVGAKHADEAKSAIESLLKKEPLKLTVGMLLVPLARLMEAEQAQLAGANSHVKRWLANEKEVLQIAVPQDANEKSGANAHRDKAALETACTVLSRFQDCRNGEIDTDGIRDDAYRIGHGLTREEQEALGIARFILTQKGNDLLAYIGSEAALLLGLCLSALGKEIGEFRSDPATKQPVSDIAGALRARTDTGEYPVPSPPKSVAERSLRRRSMPVFYLPETTATATPTVSTASATRADGMQKGDASTTPPAHSPPATPRREAPDGGSGNQSGALTASTSSTPVGSAYRTGGRPGIDMGVAIAELKYRQKTASNPATAGEASETAPASAPVTPRGRPSVPGSETGAIAVSGSSATGPGTPGTRIARKRLDRADRSDATGVRQKSDGSETSSHRTRKPETSRRARSMVYAQTGTSGQLDAADRKALIAAGDAARALKANLLKPSTDSLIYEKWKAAEQHLESVLTPETSAAIGTLISYCHQVNLEQGQERASLDRVVGNLRPQIKDKRAYIAVRDILLAESRGKANSRATTAFPELLSLLVFAIDAETARRQARRQESST